MSTVTSLHTSDFYRVLFDHSSDADMKDAGIIRADAGTSRMPRKG
jgi:hypothetical protein